MTHPSHLTEPFPGPRPFHEDEADIFFGRTAEINDLSDLIRTYPFVLLYSQSGAGKSSLIHAGLFPLLRKHGINVFPIARLVVDSTDAPKNVNIFSYSLFCHLSGNKTETITSLSVLFSREIKKRSSTEGQLHLLVIDQAEELFSAFPDRWSERQGFFEAIGEALSQNKGLRLLFVLREEYLADVEPYAEHIPFGLKIRYRLERLYRDDAIEAVRQPLAQFDWTVSDGDLDRLLSNLRKIRVSRGQTTYEAPGEYVEPVHLQVVCRDLWTRSNQGGSRDRCLTIPNDIDNLDRSLMAFYNTAIRRVVDKIHYNESKVRTWCGRQLITSRGTRKVAFKGEMETAGLPNRVVDALQEEHLVRSEPRAGGEVCELTHDRLIVPLQKANQQWVKERLLRRIPIFGAIALLSCALIYAGSRRLYSYVHLVSLHKDVEQYQQQADHELYADRDPMKAKKDYDRALKRLYEIVALEGGGRPHEATVAYIYEQLSVICEVTRSNVSCLQPSWYLEKATEHPNVAPRYVDDILDLGDFYFKSGDSSKSERAYRVAAEYVQRELGNRSPYGIVVDQNGVVDNSHFVRLSRAYEGLAQLDLRSGQSDKALEDIYKAMASLHRRDSLGQWARLIADLGAAELQEHQYGKSEKTYDNLRYEYRLQRIHQVDDLVPILRSWGLAKSEGSVPGRKPFLDGAHAIQEAYNALEVKTNGVGIGFITNEHLRSTMIEQEQYEQGFNCLALARVKMRLASNRPTIAAEAVNKLREAEDIFEFYKDPVSKNVASYMKNDIEQSAFYSEETQQRAKLEMMESEKMLQESGVDLMGGFNSALFTASHEFTRTN